ncbi:MAG TPA: formamidopyrimidine-DNA glycosylase [Firmicutes bacterium]|jgi:formamidopyrimidine-DNA glycosylase|nr:formamidopyrimidine-DNA glycosylase [Bacillota bacterium]
MPELPEVETIRRTLLPKLIGRTIINGTVLLPKLIQNIPVEEFLAQICGQKIITLDRRGKYLLFYLDNTLSPNFRSSSQPDDYHEGNLVLAIHLRMTGQLKVESSEILLEKATYMQLTLDNGNELRYRDQRKFGRIMLFETSALPKSLERLGPEPLSDEFTIQDLKIQLGKRKIAIKKALLDQEVIAGIGNIYADESLFLAGVHPARLVSSLSEKEIAQLYRAIRSVLSQAIQNRGTTKRDYRDGDGKLGSNQDNLKVYDRNGLACYQCGNMIVKMKLGGRGTHFCPICQK